MILSETHSDILRDLLKVEHSAIAQRLKFIPQSYDTIDESLLIRSIGMLDELSRLDNERARKIVITSSAILWTYKDKSWDGLRDFLILVLSRIGFPPSAIMIDATYDHQYGQFTGLYSSFNEFIVTVHQLKHEIFIQSKKYLITGFQKRVWDKLEQLKLLGISAPTSAGKSFIILLKAIDLILKGDGSIVYIVPTLSLVAQVSADFNEQLHIFRIKNYRISTTYSSQDTSSNKIYVLTQEKAISAFSQTDTPFLDVRLLVIDEIQNIEKVANEDDQRAKTLYDTLIEFRHTCNPDLTIVSGPRINGLKELGIDVFNQQEADEENTKDSPVASITYAISKNASKYYFNQYTDIVNQPNKILITNSSMISGYGGSQYRESFISYLSMFLKGLGPESRNIIFSPTASQARKTATKLAELREPIEVNEIQESLVSYLQETVHLQYDMCESIPRGFVYHHGKTPSHVRAVIERAIRDRLVQNVVCTTTLMQGVNLPAQNVILRNPYLSIMSREGKKPKLTDYEIANLRGRAGRLLKDFIGRTFVLEENSFESGDQLDLFPEAEKKLRPGYGEKFIEYESQIVFELEKNVPPSDLNQEYSFLLTYIRQMILKHQENTLDRLISVGITLNFDLYNEVLTAMDNLSVPKEVCFKNRYWDPLDLNDLYEQRELFELPESISEDSIDVLLEQSLLIMMEKFPSYYNKYFKVDTNLLRSACISAKEWMKEKPLKTILGTAYFDSSEKVEDRIALLQNNISYGLPMLLKPLYDIKAPENMFLRFIEIGAYKPITRKMIELNVPRETAISISEQYFQDFRSDEENIEGKIIYRLREIIDSLDYWRKIQIEGIV